MKLGEGALERATQARYEAGRVLLQKFLTTHYPDLSLELLGEIHIRRTVNVMCEFVEEQYNQNVAYTRCLDAILGLQQELHWLRTGLGPDWKLMSAWRMKEHVELRRPLPATVLMSTIVILLSWGMPFIAIGLWVSFHCLLRPGEFFGLKRKDTMFTGVSSQVTGMPLRW